MQGNQLCLFKFERAQRQLGWQNHDPCMPSVHMQKVKIQIR